MLRFDYLYSIRRASHKGLEVKLNLATETAWLIEALRAELT